MEFLTFQGTLSSTYIHLLHYPDFLNMWKVVFKYVKINFLSWFSLPLTHSIKNTEVISN